MKRYFLFLYPEGVLIRKLLDIAIYIFNPKEKLAAHVTLAGPYSSTRSMPKNVSFVRKVSLLGVGQFRSEWQNTVFLHVGAEDLQAFWDKPDFPFNPHLTLYDGDDANLATKLYERLFEQRLYLKFFVSRVFVVEILKGQGSMELIQSLDFSVVPDLKGMVPADILGLSDEERIDLGSRVLARAKIESNRS